jgi:hypothetical protein
MRDVQMPCGRREWLAARGSGLAKKARWKCEDVVTAAAMNPAAFLLFAAGSCVVCVGDNTDERYVGSSGCTGYARVPRVAICGRVLVLAKDL